MEKFTKMEMKKNFFLKKRDKKQLPNGTIPDTTVPILVEIVSASIKHFDERRKEGDEKILNTYCTVKDLNCGSGDLLEDFPCASPQPAKSPPTIQPKLIHKTKLIRKNNNPIWTVLTDSLCMVHISTSNVMELMEGKLEFELFHKDLNLVDKSLGSVKLRKQTLLEGDGSRIEYDLIQNKGTGRRRGLGQDHTNTSKEEELSPITSRSTIDAIDEPTTASTASPPPSPSRSERGRSFKALSRTTSFLRREKQNQESNDSSTDKISKGIEPQGNIMSAKIKTPKFPQIPGKPIQGLVQGTRNVVALTGKVGHLLHLPEKSRSYSTSVIVLRFRRAEPHEEQFMKSRASSDTSFNLSKNLLSIPKVPFLTFPGDHAKGAAKDSESTPKTKKIRMLQQDSLKKTITKPITQPMERGIKTLKMVSAGVIQKKDNVKYKVKPYPDPKDPKSTAWMTKPEIERVVLEPSRKWIQVGGRRDNPSIQQENDANCEEADVIGTLRVEIIKCQGLPNTDTGAMGDFTDSFVAMVFENNVVRSDVVYDELSPRFMPWTQRAFQFQIQHPSSLLFLGVLDHDSVGDHEQIGRVVVDLSKFKGKTEYLLTYKLHLNPDSKDERGYVTVRLCIDWVSEWKAMLKALSPPSPIRINVPDKKAFRVVRYLCRGKVDMEKATVASVKQYAYELLDYVDSIYIFIDVIINIVLWRGRIKLTVKTPPQDCSSNDSIVLDLWFPIRSIITYSIIMCAINHPGFIPSIFFFSVALVMSTICYNRSKHPSPWKRCERVDIFIQSLIDKEKSVQTEIDPFEGYDESISRDKLNHLRIERVKSLISSFQTLLSKRSEERIKLDPYHYLTASEDKHFNINVMNFAQSPLNQLHLALGGACSFLRVLRGIVNWDSYHYSFAIVVYCALIGIAFSILPIYWMIQWVCRIFVFIFFGPWMKLFDAYYVIPYFPPLHEVNEKLEIVKPNFSTAFEAHSKEVRITQEDAYKMKDMREYLFGKFMETVPLLDSSRYHSIPEPSSSARTVTSRLGPQDTPEMMPQWQYLPSQNLKKGMIPCNNIETPSKKEKMP